MPIRLDSRADDFAARFGAFLAAKREAAADVEGAVRGIIDAVKAKGDAALVEFTNKFDRTSIDRSRPARHQGRDRGGGRRLRGRGPRRARLRPRPHRGLSPPPASPRRSFHRCARRRARLALDGDRRRRALCAGRHRRLSVLGADERRAGEGRGRAAPRHGGAGAGRRAQSPGARRGRACRHRRDLPRRRRAGGGGARLRHRDHRPGRQDRRPRQRLCRGGEAPGVRQGRHRHDRRPVRGADPRRPRCQSRLDRRRSPRPGRARHRGAIDPDHRRRRARRPCRGGRRGPARDPAAGRGGARLAGRSSAP